MTYLYHLLVLLEIYCLLAISANQLVGGSGFLSLSQAMFYGLGAYTSAIMMTKFQYGFGLSIIGSIAICTIVSYLIGYIANKVRDLYFSLGTMALQIVFFSVIYNWMSVTNGSFGISGIQSPVIFGIQFENPALFSILGGFILILALIAVHLFHSSPLYRSILATKDDPIAMMSIGQNPNTYKQISITFSAILSGIAGCIYATYTSYIDPTSFTLDESILILSIVLIGGSGSLRGVLLGAMIYILIPEVLKFVHIPDGIAANMRMILFGVLLIVILRVKPNGILGKKWIE